MSERILDMRLDTIAEISDSAAFYAGRAAHAARTKDELATAVRLRQTHDCAVAGIEILAEEHDRSSSLPSEWSKSAAEWREERDRASPLAPFPDDVDAWKEAERRGIEARKRAVPKPRSAPPPAPVSIPYPRGFHYWPLDRRNEWWAEFNRLYTAAKKERGR